MNNDTRFLKRGVELPECRYDGMTRSQAIEAGYEVEDDDEKIAKENPEKYLDILHRRDLIRRALLLWEKHSYDWRIKRHEFTFYEDVKRKLKIGITLPSHMQVKWRRSLLLECGCLGDALELLNSLQDWQLYSEVNFVENWLRYDCAYNTLRAWVYDIKIVLKNSGVSEDYDGDILEHPQDFKKKPSHGYTCVPRINFGHKYNERSTAAAIY